MADDSADGRIELWKTSKRCDCRIGRSTLRTTIVLRGIKVVAATATIHVTLAPQPGPAAFPNNNSGNEGAKDGREDECENNGWRQLGGLLGEDVFAQSDTSGGALCSTAA